MEFKGIIHQTEQAPDEELLRRLPEDLAEFYRQVNGLVAYNGGLWIRACIKGSGWNSLERYWIGQKALYKTYPNLFQTDIPFAQDCAGDQFFMRDDSIWLLSGESGDAMDMETDLEGFLLACTEDPVEYLAMEPLVHYLDQHGPLPVGELVHIVPGTSLELPEDTAYHIDSLPVDKRLEWLGDFFKEHFKNGG